MLTRQEAGAVVGLTAVYWAAWFILALLLILGVGPATGQIPVVTTPTLTDSVVTYEDPDLPFAEQRQITVANLLAAGGGGAADGVVTAGVYNAGAIDFTVASPGSDFSVSGIGDITAVTTTAGLDGSTASGVASISLSLDELITLSSLSSNDYLIAATGSGLTRRVLVSNALNTWAGHGLARTGSTLDVDGSEFTTITNLSQSSDILFYTGTTISRIPRNSLATALADGSSITASGGVLSASASGVTAFTSLTDTPSGITADECVRGNSGGTALEFATCATGGSVDGVVNDATLSISSGQQLNLNLDRTIGADVNTAVLLPPIAHDGTLTGDGYGVPLSVVPVAAASAFTDLTDTPPVIAADDCVRGNAGGTALVFGTCSPGGGGDITGVTTATTSALSGGVTTGTADLRVQMDNAVPSTVLPATARFLLQASSGALRTITGIELSQAFRLEHGPFDNSTNYRLGDIVETGLGDSLIFWIVEADIVAGLGAPTLQDSGAWRVLATDGFWRGDVDQTLTYDLHEGDLYHIGDEAYIVTGDALGVTGDDLRTGDHVIEISDPLLRDEGTLDTDGLIGIIDCVGGALSCDVSAQNIATIMVSDISDLGILASLQATDQVRVADSSDTNTEKRTELSALGSYFADGLTITASAQGVLTSVGGGATLTDATLDVSTPGNESTTEGASRQSIAEAIAANVGSTGSGLFSRTEISTLEILNPSNLDAVTVTLTRAPSAGTMLQLVIDPTGTGYTSASAPTALFPADEFLALTALATEPPTNNTGLESAIILPIGRPNTNSIASAGATFTVNRSTTATEMFLRAGFWDRYGSSFDVEVWEFTATGAPGATGPAGPQGADGTGSGDITAVNTPAASGLAGGSGSGDVSLRVDLDGLADLSGTVAGADVLGVSDQSAPNDPTYGVTVDDLGAHIVGANPGGTPATDLDTVTVLGDDLRVRNTLSQTLAEDETSADEGMVTGGLLADAINVHATSGHSVLQVSRLPDTETDAIVYLTHDYLEGSRDDATLTVGELESTYEGWSSGRLFGAVGSTNRDMGCVIAVIGVHLSGPTYILNQVWSQNRACLANVDGVKIGSTTYTNIALRSSLGDWVLTVSSAPTLSSATVDVNLRFSDGTWKYNAGSGTTYTAGMYEWDPDDVEYVKLYAGDAVQGLDFTGSNGIFDQTLTDGDLALFLDIADLAGPSTVTLASDDRIAFADYSTANDGTRSKEWGTVVSGMDSPATGLLAAGTVLTFSPSGIPQALLDTTADFIVFQDISDGNSPRREAAQDFFTLVAGTDLAFSGGQLNVSHPARGFESLTDTPASITADECIRGNSAGDRLEFFTCPAGEGGTGDITSVTTANDSGLAGGATSGAVALELDLGNVGAGGAIAAVDRIPVYDTSNTETVYETFATVAQFQAGVSDGGLASNGGRLELDVSDLALLGVLASSDRIPIMDDSASDGTLAATVATLGEYFADSTTLTASNAGVLSIRSNVELPGGPTVGTAPANNLNNRRIATTAWVRANAPDAVVNLTRVSELDAGADYLAFYDASQSVSRSIFFHDAYSATLDDLVEATSIDLDEDFIGYYNEGDSSARRVNVDDFVENIVALQDSFSPGGCVSQRDNGKLAIRISEDCTGHEFINTDWHLLVADPDEDIPYHAPWTGFIDTLVVGDSGLEERTHVIDGDTVLGIAIEDDVNLGGSPTTTTAPLGTDSTRIATTEFVLANAGGGEGDVTAIDAGDGIRIDDGDTATPEVNIANSAALPGNPTTTTQTVSNNSTRIATTQYVRAQVGILGDVSGLDAGDGIRIDDGATSTPEVNIANNADLPGSPTTSTAPTVTNSTRIATTAYVRAQSGIFGDVSGIDAGDGIRVDDGATGTPEVNIADNGVGAAKLDPESASVGQVMMIGTGGDPDWAFPFEFPRTRSTRDIAAVGGVNQIAAVSATKDYSAGDTVSVSGTMTVSRVPGTLTTTACNVRFYVLEIQISRLIGNTIVLAAGEAGPATMTITATQSISQSRSGMAPVSMGLSGVNCQIDSGATLTIS